MIFIREILSRKRTNGFPYFSKATQRDLWNSFFLLVIPNFFRISSIKHHRVKEDCSRLKPTNAVNHNQLMFT